MESQETCTDAQKKRRKWERKEAKKRKETETYVGRTDDSLASLSLLFVFPMEPSLRRCLPTEDAPTQVGRIGVAFVVVVNRELAVPRQNQVYTLGAPRWEGRRH